MKRVSSWRAGAPLLVALSLLVQGCLQLDQTLPLGLEEGQVASRTIGSGGGIISVPPDFSLSFPAGAVAGQANVTAQPRITAPFPTDAGDVLPGTAFDVTPKGLTLATPATVQIRVPETLLNEGDDVKLGVAVIQGDGSLVTSAATYDATAGLISSQISTIGSMAAVIELDAIDVETGGPPTLGGGTFGGVPTPPGAPTGISADGQRYVSSCAPTGRRCFASGLVRVWISDALRERVGESLVIVKPVVDADLEFLTFDGAGQPTSVIGRVDFQGTLKARIGQAVTLYDFEELASTGSGGSPAATDVTVSGNRMTFSQTSDGSNKEFEFGLTRIATGELLTLRVEDEISLELEGGGTETGTVIIHMRLRR